MADGRSCPLSEWRIRFTPLANDFFEGGDWGLRAADLRWTADLNCGDRGSISTSCARGFWTKVVVLQQAECSSRAREKRDIHVAQSSDKWLSILIPVYNVLPYLRECVVSIINQIDGDGVEIILLDDASTDGSFQLCEEICREYDGRIGLLRHPENRGLSAARNTMVEAATGEYVWFVDSDDEIFPGAIKSLRGILDNCSPDIVMCDYRKMGKDYASFSGKSGVFQDDREILVRGIFESRRMHTWSKISRRELWSDDLRFPIGRCFEDAATTPWLFLKASSFYYAAEPWVVYRVRSDSITGIVSRTRGKFDDKKNDDLAFALMGFSKSLTNKISNIDDDTLYAVSNFCGKEFTKISYRLLSARLFRDDWNIISSKIARYRDMMDDCSPMTFSCLTREHLRRRNVGRWVILKLCLFAAASRTLRGRSENRT